MDTKIGRAVEALGRGSEWITSCVLIGFGVALFYPGETLAGSGYRAFAGLGLTDFMLGSLMASSGILRSVGLIINGRWRRSPTLRVVGALIGSTLFTMLAAAFAAPSFSGSGGLSTGATTYLVLAVADALAAYRSGFDARSAYHA